MVGDKNHFDVIAKFHQHNSPPLNIYFFGGSTHSKSGRVKMPAYFSICVEVLTMFSQVTHRFSPRTE